MDKRWLAAGALVAGIAIVGYALFSRKTPEEEVREQLARLAAAIAVREEAENPVMRATRLNGEFADLFDKNARARIPEISSPIENRKELVALAARAGMWVRALDVDFSRLDVEAGELNASADGPAQLSGVRVDGTPERGDRTVHFQLSKIDSEWKITSVSVEPKPDE
jgi:hypothetical protein